MGGTSESQELYRYSQEDRHQSGVVPVVQPLLSAVMCLGYRWMGQAKAKSCTVTARKIIAISQELYRYSQEDHAHQWGLYRYNQEDHAQQPGIQEYSLMIKFTCWLCMRASLLYMMLPSWSTCAM